MKIFCKICGEDKKIKINKNDFFLRSDSSHKKINNFKNFICYNCGTIYHIPEINYKKLDNFYKNIYRKTNSALDLGDATIDLPLKFEWTNISFQRFYAFYDILKKTQNSNIANKKIFDYGCYQGAFLYACQNVLRAKGVGADYDINGLKLAKYFFNIKTYNINKSLFKRKIKAKIITLLHVFEHLVNPVDFLIKIKKNLLEKNGLIYLEIPNPFSNPLNDPTHLFLYSENTIKYILERCNYEILYFDKRELYKNNTLLRNNKKLNIHILARSLNAKKIDFPKIYIGPKVHSDLLKERNLIGVYFVVKKLKHLFFNMIENCYIVVMFLLNLFSSNLAIYIHNKLKNMLSSLSARN
jgi:2-polyprenyl-3-methyl-5-hydroxy-6-metoxy-1,4-benzoquinol methylase